MEWIAFRSIGVADEQLQPGHVAGRSRCRQAQSRRSGGSTVRAVTLLTGTLANHSRRVGPPFGLWTLAMFMQRTSEAISHIHAIKGYHSRPYLDDFRGAEATIAEADNALGCLQSVMRELGIVEAEHKVCPPAQSMIWLGILYNSVSMEMSIPPQKLQEIGKVVAEWGGRTRATQREIQSLFGLLQFVASVTKPARLFTNRILENLREAPKRGYTTLSLGFRRDLKFFADLLPHYNGVRIMLKREVQCQEALELDACLRGCGAFTGDQFYSEVFPPGAGCKKILKF